MPTHIRKAGMIGILIVLAFVFIPAISVNRVGAQSCEISDWWEREAQPILVEYFDVAEIAALLGRLNLGPVLIDLRAAERRFEFLETPDCAAEAKRNFYAGMQFTFLAFVYFIEEDNVGSDDSFESAKDYFLDAFLNLQSLDELVFNFRFGTHFLTEEYAEFRGGGELSVTFSRPTPTPTRTPRPTTTPRPSSTPQATLSVDQIQANISSITCENSRPVSIVRIHSPGNITEEGIEIRNSGDVINLENFVLFINNDLPYFVFPPDYRLYMGGSTTVYSRVGDDSPIALFADLISPQLDTGMKVTLVDDNFCILDSVDVP